MALFKSRKLPANKYVAEASFVKRIGAVIIDFISAAFIGVLAYFAIVHPVWLQHLGGVAANQALNQVKLDSGLYTGNQDEVFRYTNRADYDRAMRIFYSWEHFSFIDSDLYSANNTTFSYDEDILQLNSANSIFTTPPEKQSDGSYIYTYRTDLAPGAIDSFWTASYNAALGNLAQCPLYFNTQAPIRNFIFIGGSISYLLAGLLLHLALPLLQEDGRTIGKMAFGLGVVTYEGYRLKRMKFVVRFLFTDIVEIAGSLLYLLPLFLTMVVMTLSPGLRPLHDHVAHSRVIDWKNSYVFASEGEALAYFDAEQKQQPTTIYPGGGKAQGRNRQRKAENQG